MNEQIRQIKRYLRPRIFSRELLFLIIGVLSVGFAISFYVRTIKDYFETGVFDIISTWEVSTLLLFCIFLCCLEGIYKSIKFSIQLHEWKKTGEMSDILRDFEHARPMHNDRVMMGREYAFGKNCYMAVAYADIDRVFEYVHSTNSIKDQRKIRVKMINGKQHDLCHLRVLKRENEEEMAIIQTILEHNPSIKVGAD